MNDPSDDPAEVLDLTLFANARISDDEFAAFGSERVLAEAAAKRRIIKRHGARWLDRWLVCTNCRPEDPEFPDDLTSTLWPCPDLRDLLAGYAFHPDYHESWKPTAIRVQP